MNKIEELEKIRNNYLICDALIEGEHVIPVKVLDEFIESVLANRLDADVRQRKLPKEIKIFDITYKITYTNKPSEVDIFKRESLWGQIDYWTRTIRIYNNGLSIDDIWQRIWHELLHGICDKLKLEDLKADEKVVDLLATGINSIIVDNKF